MFLKNLVIADPVGNVAELISKECRRLARHRVVATHGEQTLNLVKEWRPEVLLLSLEIAKPSAELLLPKITAAAPDILILGTYRTLPATALEKLQRLGVDAALAHPIAAQAVYTLIAQRFSLPFRALQRFLVDASVKRADGAPLGKLLDLSQTGLRLQITDGEPLLAEQSIDVALDLDDGVEAPLSLKCRVLSVSERGGKTVARGQFVDLQGEVKERLVAYVAKLTKKLDALSY